jgi:hypothetical protein
MSDVPINNYELYIYKAINVSLRFHRHFPLNGGNGHRRGHSYYLVDTGPLSVAASLARSSKASNGKDPSPEICPSPSLDIGSPNSSIILDRFSPREDCFDSDANFVAYDDSD